MMSILYHTFFNGGNLTYLLTEDTCSKYTKKFMKLDKTEGCIKQIKIDSTYINSTIIKGVFNIKSK